jgi:hypothetical protein
VPNADHCGARSTAPDEFRDKVLGWFASHASFSPALLCCGGVNLSGGAQLQARAFEHGSLF